MKKFSLALLLFGLLASTIVLAGEKEKTVLKVKGIHCGGCAVKIKKALNQIDGVADPAVDRATGEVAFVFDPEKKPVEKAVKAITELGYTVVNGDSTTGTTKDCCAAEGEE